MKALWLSLFGMLTLSACTNSTNNKRDVTVAVLGDLHFDLPPETDQYYHVRALNNLEEKFCIPQDSINGIVTGTVNHLHGVIIAGDMFDKPFSEIHDLYR